MDIKDVYTALQQGDIDAQENGYQPMYSARFYEVQKYLSDSGHVFELLVFIASKKAFARLPPEHQKAVMDAARTATVQEWRLAAEADETALEALKAKGMQFDAIPAATRVELRKAMSGVIDDARKRLGSEIVDQVAAAAAH
jgi:TRAP-type C4-dicarboxylate transport system substrate-binding protein